LFAATCGRSRETDRLQLDIERLRSAAEIFRSLMRYGLPSDFAEALRTLLVSDGHARLVARGPACGSVFRAIDRWHVRRPRAIEYPTDPTSGVCPEAGALTSPAPAPECHMR
jgi:hypothetical protein